MLRISGNKGFAMTFENGFTISVQFGSSNYCENRSFDDYGKEMEQQHTTCQNAEIAIWDEVNEWFDFGGDQVKGWVRPDEISDWITRTKNATTIKTL